MLRSHGYPYPTNYFPTHEIDLSPTTNPELMMPYSDHGPQKKRKVDRACDACRRRKTKCDGPKMPDSVCTNCLQTRKPCTYLEASKPRGPPKAYVTGLEDRVEQLEALLEQLQPGVDFSDEIGPPIVRGSWKSDDYTSTSASQPKSQSSSASAQQKKAHSSSSVALHPVGGAGEPARSSGTRGGRISPPPLVNKFVGLSTHLPFSAQTRQNRGCLTKPNFYTIPTAGDVSDLDFSDEDEEPGNGNADALVDRFGGEPQRLTLRSTNETVVDPEDNHRRFHGKSSVNSLVDATRRFKEMHLMEMEGSGKHSGFTPPPITSDTRRPEFWCSPKWELVWEGIHVDSAELIPQVLSKFPPDDLAASLVELYFVHSNTAFPLLHRPTFERQWAQKLHHRDIWFACLCLSLFGVASRWSDDVRVLAPGPAVKTEKGEGEGEGEIDWSSAGWRYFTAGVDIHRYRRSLLYPASLFEIQTFTLLAMFLRGTTSPAAAWMFVSIGLRKAQDAGAHRRNVYRDYPTVDEELWKRAVWCLIMSDRIGGTGLGRGVSIGEEDFDLDLPLEVDDEYWEPADPAMAFKQPPGVPSKLTAFNLLCKLMQILSFTMKTIYVVNKPKVFSGVFSLDWRDEILAQLNRAMDDWAEAIPEFLRWSEDMPDHIFSNQAATLYITYYMVQMVIFRPYVPSPMLALKESSSLARASASASASASSSSSSASYSYSIVGRVPFPAMAICTTAARSCARIIKGQLRRGFSNIPAMCMVAHTGGGMLCWAMWDIKVQERIRRAAGMMMGEEEGMGRKIEEFERDVEVFVEALEKSQMRWAMVTPLLANLRESLPGPSEHHPQDDVDTPSLSPAHLASLQKEATATLDIFASNWRAPNPPSWSWADLSAPTASTSSSSQGYHGGDLFARPPPPSAGPSSTSSSSMYASFVPRPAPAASSRPAPPPLSEKDLDGLYSFADVDEGQGGEGEGDVDVEELMTPTFPIMGTAGRAWATVAVAPVVPTSTSGSSRGGMVVGEREPGGMGRPRTASTSTATSTSTGYGMGVGGANGVPPGTSTGAAERMRRMSQPSLAGRYQQDEHSRAGGGVGERNPHSRGVNGGMNGGMNGGGLDGLVGYSSRPPTSSSVYGAGVAGPGPSSVAAAASLAAGTGAGVGAGSNSRAAGVAVPLVDKRSYREPVWPASSSTDDLLRTNGHSHHAHPHPLAPPHHNHQLASLPPPLHPLAPPQHHHQHNHPWTQPGPFVASMGPPLSTTGTTHLHHHHDAFGESRYRPPPTTTVGGGYGGHPHAVAAAAHHTFGGPKRYDTIG